MSGSLSLRFCYRLRGTCMCVVVVGGGSRGASYTWGSLLTHPPVTPHPPGPSKKQAYVRKQYGKDVDPADCRSPIFEAYYREQRIVPASGPADEWALFLATLRSSLPLSVRVSRFREGWAQVVAELQEQQVCTVIPWYPGSLAWRCPNDVYHAEGTKAKEFKSWVKRENAIGSLTFQEEVSLLPPLLLDVKPDSVVLDMCAAPGSKTLEALEIMHADDSWGGGCVPTLATGVLVANDSDARRMNNILVPRVRKLHTPCIMATIGNAAKFPCFPASEQWESAKFDRILLDAPCSGDGTMRKEPQIWQSWSLKNGLELHHIQ